MIEAYKLISIIHCTTSSQYGMRAIGISCNSLNSDNEVAAVSTEIHHNLSLLR